MQIRAKARERQLGELKQNTEVESFPPRAEQGKTREIVAEKSGFGSGKNFEKAKYIADNADKG
jgi:ParB family chromosome partitioning protein